jgi:hypothetical protein
MKSKEEKNEKQIIRKRSWKQELVEYSDGTSKMNREVNGFTELVLLGLLEYMKSQIIKQLRGRSKPNVIERTVVKNVSEKQ